MQLRLSRCRRKLRPELLLPPALLLAGLAHAAADDDARLIADVAFDPARPSGAARGDEDLYLQVTLNQADTARLAHFVRGRDGALRASVATLRELGFALPGREPSETVVLDTLPGVSVRYDAAAQRVNLDAPLSQLSLDTAVLNRPAGMASNPPSASPGALLNYDLYASHARGSSNLAATAELRLFGVGAGVLSTSALTRAYRDNGQGWRGESVRLDTNWQLSFPDSALTLTIGDSYSGALNWTRSVRMGGVQIGRNFGLQPYRVITPLPAFLGEAALPSAVELYVNGIRQYSGEVAPGPFQLSTMPGINGAGNAQIVVTDGFGRMRTIDFPFYATQQLLAGGLSDWSLGLGVVREDYGIRSFSYASEPVANGTLRYGVSDAFTFEAHAEGGGGLANAGLGGLWLLGRAGVLSASYARSALDGAHGGQTAFGYNWNNRRFNLSLDSQRTHGDYRDVASLYGWPPAEISERALAGVNVPGLGNVSASYLRLRYPEREGAPGTDADPESLDTRYAGLFWSQTYARGWTASLSYNQNLDDRDDRTVYLGISVPLDGQRHASASLQRNGRRDNAVIDVSKPLAGDGSIDRDYGWRLQARTGDDGEGGLAEIGWLSPVGRYSAGIAAFDGDAYGYASASGSLVWMGGHAFAARNITDAFAVVSTDGLAGVPVKLENRLVGRTDGHGMLLVTPLHAWQDNKLAIDPLDLPANMRIDRVEALATPRDRSGVRVRFGLATVRAAVLVLHDDAGAPLPLGSRVHAPGQAEPTVIGYDGETYLDTLQPHNRLRIERPEGGACSVEFDYPADGEAIPRIGPLPCTKEAAP